MPLYEGMGLGTDKHSVIIEMGHSFTRFSFDSILHELTFKENAKKKLISLIVNQMWIRL